MEVRIGSFESAQRALCYLGKRSCEELRAFVADLVAIKIERFQRGAEQIKPNRNAEKRG